MSIKTTINIKPHLEKQILDVADTFKITVSEVVTLIIYKVITKPDPKIEMLSSVKYQEKNKTLKWEKLHVSYDEEVYEVTIDLRKILKKSVSKIIAEGIQEFLGEIVRDLCKNKKREDNYFPSYIFSLKADEKTCSFTTFWGHPIQEILKNYTN